VDTVSIIPEGGVVYGIQLPIQSQSTMYREDWETTSGPAELARIARQADESDFFYIAVCDHTFIPERLAGAMSTTWYDTVATLGWLAGITSRVRLLSHVYIATLRHPLRAAKEFATLDLLSGGRLIVGVGAGHVVEEFEVLGPEFGDRGKALDESIDGIAAALTDEFPPIQTPRPPIWVGGSSRPALRRAAAHGDGWLPQTAKRSELKEQITELLGFRDQLAEGAPIAIGALAGIFHVGQPTWELPRGTVTGSPEKIAEDLAEIVGYGASHLQLRFPSRSVEELCDQMAAFGEQVGPLLGT
jgi:alkanesulfonate monooxygenase SsuD/methylene tetrahydromethanopterin reductase-like flavin-dependent oxidoreductase (luciferase family)